MKNNNNNVISYHYYILQYVCSIKKQNSTQLIHDPRSVQKDPGRVDEGTWRWALNLMMEAKSIDLRLAPRLISPHRFLCLNLLKLQFYNTMFGDSDKGNACLMSNLEHLVVICIAMIYFKLYCSYGLRIWKISCGHLFQGFVSKSLFFGLEKGDLAFRLFDVCVTQCQKENRFGDVIETISCFYRRKQQMSQRNCWKLVAFESHKSCLIRFDYILRDISRKQS